MIKITDTMKSRAFALTAIRILVREATMHDDPPRREEIADYLREIADEASAAAQDLDPDHDKHLYDRHMAGGN